MTAPPLESDARPLWNGRFDDVRPRAVAHCASVHEVVAAVAHVRSTRQPLAVRAGGHGFGGHATTDGVVIDVSTLDEVAVEDGAVRIGAGARLGDVHRVLDRHDLALPAGTCPPVGITGLALGGGLGILGRMHGVLSDHLVGARVVLADGRVIDCDEHRHDDLLWALRGAGAGTFGVVTELRFTPVEAPVQAVNVQAEWPGDHAAELISRWQRLAPDGPPELAASLKVTVSTDRDLPPRVGLHAAFFGTERDAAHALRDLLGHRRPAPAATTVTVADHPGTRALWATLGGPGSTEADAMEDTAREQVFATSAFLDRPLGRASIDALLHATLDARVEGEARELDFMPWGGAYARRRPQETAFVHRDDRCLLKLSTSVALDASPGASGTAAARVATMHAAIATAATGRSFQNFADPALPRWSPAYYGDNLPRLLATKARYDPDDVFDSHP